ncbi:MAG: methyltransferase domain-containing protein [Betaproteobacteria bacterium]
MSDAESKIVEHYATNGLLARLEAALRADGADPAHPTIEALAPYDQFHGRGLEATKDMAALVAVRPADHLLDVGSGLGGPARWLSTRFGCRVTGIDLTPEFCAIAEHFTRLMGLDARVRFQVGNALAMPFEDDMFEGAYSMFVSMNIADKAQLYREIHRVLKPGGWLVLSEIARGEHGDVMYPMPWAATAAESFLSTADDTRRGLRSAGFEVEQVKNDLQRALDFGAQSRAMVERGEKPPYRANALIHGDIAAATLANVARSYKDGSLIPIEVVARKR